MSIASVAAPLLPGQRLSRAEFLRRWEALPDLKKAELIDGLVYMASPVSATHGSHDLTLHTWLGTYAAATPGCTAGCNRTWLMLESAPQPDADLCVLPQFGGQSGFSGDYCVGAPELAVEVSNSTSGNDSGPKLALYQRAGVKEYLTLVLDPPLVDWRERTAEGFVPLQPDAEGLFRSRVFPGLWLDPRALLRNDGASILRVLHLGLQSAEHAAFVSGLKRKAT